jgi:formamidopyrimidine-DNA glycosylase
VRGAPPAIGPGRPTPELPEVERARALLEARALGRRVVAVHDGDTWVCRPHAPGEIAAAMRGVTLTAARRRGKAIWLETDGGDGPVLGIHLGMAGRIVVDDAEAGDPRSETERGDPRRWDRFALTFDDGGRLALRDARRLGRVRLEPDLDGVGPDAAQIGRVAFRERVGRSSAAIKARILDQSVLAGVGNLLADEALWRARIDPRRPAQTLAVDDLDRLRRAVRAATRDAIRLGGVHTGRIVPFRGPGGHCPRCGAEMQRATVGGRTTWWCPREQR